MKRLFLSLSFLVSGFLFAGEDWSPQPIGPFSGVNNRDSSFAIPAQNAQDALNVNITPGGKSVFKRKGYGVAFTLTNSTSPVHGVYTFFDSNGNTVDLFANDTYLSGSVGAASPTVIFSNGPNGATYQCTDTLGFAYCANSARTTLTKTNGITASSIANVASTGTMVATCVNRLAMAGFLDRPSGIDFSADSNFTSWGTGSLGSSPVELTVSAPGSKITGIVYAFGRLMWFKDSSFGYVLLGNQPLQSDWVVRTVSYDVGTNDNSFVYREGILYFRGQDGHIYAFDGSSYQRASREIAGTIATEQNRTTGSWLQSTQADFSAGAQSPGGFIDTATYSGQMFLATATAISSFVDTVSTDFGAAFSIVNVDTTTISNSVILQASSVSVKDQYYPPITSEDQLNTCVVGGSGGWIAQSFTATTSYFSVQVTLRLLKQGTIGNHTVSIYSDNSGTPGASLGSATLTDSNVTTSTTDVSVVISSVSILASTNYWIRIDAPASCSNSGTVSRLIWDFEFTGPSLVGIIKESNGATLTTVNVKFKVSGRSYASNGSITSRAFDVGFSTANWLWNWSTLTANSTIPSGTLTYETQTSSSATGVFTSLAPVTSGSSPTSLVQEFIRYKASFTSNGSTSPVLNDLTIANSARTRPSGTFYSSIKNASFLTAWDSFNATVQNNGGTQTFYIRAATNVFTVLSSTPSWTAVSNGGVPSISTGTYFQIRDDFLITLTTQNATLFDFTQNWFEGAAADKSYATYFDDKIWFEVTAGAGSTTNNKTLVYDMINQTWILYDLAANGFYVRQNRLYFGSAIDGHIYKFGDTDNDNGAAINAYWKSKDFFGGNPFTTQEMVNISVVAKQVSTSSMTVTYSINGSSDVAYVMPLYSANSLFVNKNKNIPGGTTAGDFNVKFGNNAADQPFEVFGVQVGIRPKTWIPN